MSYHGGSFKRDGIVCWDLLCGGALLLRSAMVECDDMLSCSLCVGICKRVGSCIGIYPGGALILEAAHGMCFGICKGCVLTWDGEMAMLLDLRRSSRGRTMQRIRRSIPERIAIVVTYM